MYCVLIFYIIFWTSTGWYTSAVSQASVRARDALDASSTSLNNLNEEFNNLSISEYMDTATFYTRVLRCALFIAVAGPTVYLMVQASRWI